MEKWRPELTQMIIAIFISLGTFMLYPFLLVLFDYFVYNKGLDNDGSFSYGLGVWIFIVLAGFLPLNTLILMLLHWSRIVHYVLYSKLLVVIETFLFLGVVYLADNLNRYLEYKVDNNEWIMLVIISMVCSAFMIRLIINPYYMGFKNRFRNLFDNTHPFNRYAVNKECDYVIISFLLLGGFISVCVLFIWL